MKKAILFLVISLLGAMSIAAQTASIDNPDFKVKVKNCTAIDKDVFLDFIITNLSDNDLRINILAGNKSAAYDDEGNIYKTNSGSMSGLLYIYDPSSQSFSYNGLYDLPAGISVKARIKIKNVLHSATEFAQINLGCDYDCRKITLKNIPISRE